MSYHHDMFLAIARKTKVLASHTPRFAPSRCNSASALGGKMLQKGEEFKQQNKMRFKMNQKLTRNVGLKAGKIMDPSNQNWTLTHNT